MIKLKSKKAQIEGEYTYVVKIILWVAFFILALGFAYFMLKKLGVL